MDTAKIIHDFATQIESMPVYIRPLLREVKRLLNERTEAIAWSERAYVRLLEEQGQEGADCLMESAPECVKGEIE